MFKFKSKRLVGGAMLASLAALALTASAEPRCVYYIGEYSGWNEPIESNAAKFENYKLHETEEGSNIFSGVVAYGPNYYGYDHHFRFYSSLLPDDECSEVNWAWGINTICPAQIKGDGVELDAKSVVNKVPFRHIACNNSELEDAGGGTWVIRGHEYETLKFTLDFNTNELTVVTDGYLLVMDGQAEPTPATYANYSCTGNKVYIPEGPCRFRLYDPMTDSFCGVRGSDDQVVTDTYVGVIKSRKGTGSFVIPNWGGGVLELGNNGIYISNNWHALNQVDTYDPANYSEILSIIGDFGENIWSEDVDMVKDGNRFTGIVPVGASMWKVRSNYSWDYNFGVNYGYDVAVAGHTTFLVLAESGGNFEYVGGLPEDYKLTVDIDRKIAWMWPASQGEADPIPDGFYDRNNEKPQVPVIEPFSGALVVTPNDSFDFTAVPPSQVLGSCHQATKTNGAYTFSISSDQSFCIYEFDNDKFVRAICPNGDTTLYFANGEASSRVTVVTDPAKATMWSFDPAASVGNVEVTINPDDISLTAAKFDKPSSREKYCIYLIGNVNGWYGPDESNAENLEKWTLNLTETGEYYGEFDMPEAPMFRFYAALTGWDGGDSWGCQYEDWAVDYENFIGDVTYTLVNGKGSYYFYNRPAGKMYILVDLNNGRVTFSNDPITHSDLVDPGTAKVKEVCQMLIDGNAYTLTESESGVYTGYVSVSTDNDNEIRIFKSPGVRQITVNDPEWEGSYALKFNADAVFDEGGVAEVPFEYIDHITTEKVAPLTLSTYYYFLYFVVDFNNSKVYIDQRNSSYIVGTITNGKRPTYATRHEFEFANGAGNAYIIDLPAGDSELEVYTLSGNHQPEDQMVLKFENGVAEAERNINGINVKVVDFEGGRIAMEATYSRRDVVIGDNTYYQDVNIIKATQIDKIGAVNIVMGETVIPMTRVEGDELIFKGAFSFDTTAENWKGFSLVSDLSIRMAPYNVVGPECGLRLFHNPESFYVPGKEDITIRDYVKGTIDLTINLSTLTARIIITNDIKVKKMQVMVPLNRNGFSGVLAYAEPGVTDYIGTAFGFDGNAIIDGEVSFNIIDENNNLLVPVGDGTIDFSERGTRLVAFKRLTAKEYTIEEALAAPMWHFSAELAENRADNIVGVSINESIKRIQVTYNNRVNDLYGARVKVKDGQFPTKLAEISDYRLTANEDGTFSTTMPIFHDEGFAIVGGVGYDGAFSGCGVATRSGRPGVIDMHQEVVEVPVGSFLATNASYWTLEGHTGATYEITYDPARSIVRVSRTTLGVESVSVDSEIVVRAIAGGIEVISDAAVEVPVYNLAGARVAVVSASEGTPGHASLAPGVYIAAGHKVLVK